MSLDHYQALLNRCAEIGPLPTIVVHPCEANALRGALEATQAGLITPILVGPRQKIAATASEAGLDIDGLTVEDVPQPRRRRAWCRPDPPRPWRVADERQPAQR